MRLWVWGLPKQREKRVGKQLESFILVITWNLFYDDNIANIEVVANTFRYFDVFTAR
jgi:hypothetical protein